MLETAEMLVDTARYPVGELEGAPAKAFVERSRAQLSELGAVELEGFVHPDGVRALAEDADTLAARAHHSEGLGTAYLEIPDFDAPEDHPRRRLGHYGVGAVAYDLVPVSSPLRMLYEWDPLMRLVEAILDRGELYRYADPFGALNLAVMREGDELQWHFDQTDFVVSLAIRPADEGGDFEVAPRVRDATDERYEEVAKVLDGSGAAEIVTMPMKPGTLLVFEGRHSLHRVSPICGPAARLVGLLAYDTRPGTTGSDLLRLNRYGRSEPFAQPPERWPAG